jgi:hypothetical protein
MPCRAKSIKEKRLPDAGPLRYCTASESDGRIFSATHIRHASRPNSLGSNIRACSHISAAWHTRTPPVALCRPDLASR